MRFDRSSESYRARALRAEVLAETYARSGDGRWAAIWRSIAEDMRSTALRIAMAPRPAAEMAVSL